MFEITRNEVSFYYLLLSTILKDEEKYSKIFLYYINLNLRRIKDEAESVIALRESSAPTEGYNYFVNNKNELLKKYFIQNDDGSLHLPEENKEEFNNEYQKLLDSHGKYGYEHDAYINELTSFLESKISVDFVKIPFRYFPQEILKFHFDNLNFLIEEDEKELLERFK